MAAKTIEKQTASQIEKQIEIFRTGLSKILKDYSKESASRGKGEEKEKGVYFPFEEASGVTPQVVVMDNEPETPNAMFLGDTLRSSTCPMGNDQYQPLCCCVDEANQMFHVCVNGISWFSGSL